VRGNALHTLYTLSSPGCYFGFGRRTSGRLNSHQHFGFGSIQATVPSNDRRRIIDEAFRCCVFMEQKRILVIEDDSAIRRGIVDALQFAGYQTLQASNGNVGMTEAVRASFDLLLLDLILPGQNGFDILKATREVRPTLPVIVLTARGEEADRVQGLRLGADDYVVKPFSVRELLARVEAVLRRSPERPTNI